MRIERVNEVALLRMEAGKANAIGRDFLRALDALLDEVEGSGARALVLTGYDRYFSAGLDLPSLVAFDRASLVGFIGDFGRVMLRLFALPMPVVAAINGHAVAGGCVIALQADHRIMADLDCRIGLNEAQLGIGLPSVVTETLRSQVPAWALRPIALEGRLFAPHEARGLELVNEVVPERELLELAIERAERMSRNPGAVRQIKAALRGPVIAAVRATEAVENASWVEVWFSDEGQRGLREAAARIKKR